MRRSIGYALIAIAALTLLVWGVSQFIQPILPSIVNSSLVLFLAEWIARQMEDTFKKYPHQHASSAQERDVRIALYGVLLKENTQAKEEGRETKEIGELTALVDQIMKIAGRAGEDG
jgi:L-lactate permease